MHSRLHQYQISEFVSDINVLRVSVKILWQQSFSHAVNVTVHVAP